MPTPPDLERLKIPAAARRRPARPFALIALATLAAAAAAAYFAWPRPSDASRVVATSAAPPPADASPEAAPSDSALTATGHIINRERIELSPRFVGIVKWIGVKKGDPVAKDQVVVTLDDAEQAARVAEADGAVAAARTRVEQSELDLRRAEQLRGVDSDKIIDDARIGRDAARAALRQSEGQLALVRAYLDWTVIRSPIDGVVLEKLVEPGELVSPQSFGGPRGPSTAFLALADPKDLQVEIDVSEAELAKIRPGQPCRVSPEAYPDRRYQGRVAEIAPEANRAKGTLQIKVQIENPDAFLVPEFTARVDFLK